MTQLVQRDFSQQDIELIKRNIAKDASDNELKLFLQICNRTGLDPFARQIFFVKRAGVGQTTLSIDGFRLVAERSGRYEGQVGPHWCGEDGIWKDVWLSQDAPAAARVGVFRSGFREPLYAVANWNAYNANSPIWRKMPALMLAKCAEALALRRGFPMELSGLYTTDEMDQAMPQQAEPIEDVKPRLPSLENPVLKAFFGVGVTQKDLEAALGKSMADWNDVDTKTLREAFQSIRSGQPAKEVLSKLVQEVAFS